jgi:hypothetical protein
VVLFIQIAIVLALLSGAFLLLNHFYSLTGPHTYVPHALEEIFNTKEQQ